MARHKVAAMVQGGKASAGPPLGPALGPLGVKIPDVIAQINQKTKGLAGMDVPVTVIVHEDKSFSIEVGTPPTSALIKRELKIEKGSKEAGKLRAGDLTTEQVRRVALIKFGSDEERFQRQVEGTARSMGVTVGKGAVTQEEIAAYEKAKAAEQAAEEAKAAAAQATPAPAAAKAEEPKKEAAKAAAPAPAEKAATKKPDKKGK